jgi:hypothetical protein
MWMHFPHDPIAHTRDGQYMWWGAILFSPVLVENATSVEAYFPYGHWFSLFDNSFIDAANGNTDEGGVMKTLFTPLNSTNAHVRGGHVVPMQDAAMTVNAVRSSPFTLLVALGENFVAGGTLFLDDGEQNNINAFSQIVYESDQNFLRSLIRFSNYSLRTAWLRNVEVWGAPLIGNNCGATLVINGKTIYPLSVTVEYFQNHSKLHIVFDQSNSVNIISDYQMSWFCTTDDTDSTDSSTDSASLESYQVALISVAAVLGFAALAVVSYIFYFRTHWFKKSDPLLHQV